MLVRGGTRVAYTLFDAVFRPTQFVRVEQQAFHSVSTLLYLRILQLAFVWLINVILYAVPLTMAGIGFTTDQRVPAWFEQLSGPFLQSPETAWQLLVGTVQNSAFLTVATLLVFVTFHGSVVTVSRSRGYFQSLYTVVYTTSIYLVGIFTVVVYISTTEALASTEEFLVNLQVSVFQAILDLLGVGLTISGLDPGPVTLSGVSQAGLLLLGVLVILLFYFLYSLYLGAVLNHQLSKRESMVVVLGVLASPFVYIVGLVVLTLATEAYGETILTLTAQIVS